MAKRIQGYYSKEGLVFLSVMSDYSKIGLFLLNSFIFFKFQKINDDKIYIPLIIFK